MMDIIPFGESLIKTEDLDPVYIGLYGAQLPRPQLYRWLLAYFCYYHAGVASFISEAEGAKYWYWMKIAAGNVQPSPLGERWPRAAERRHFRGEKCVRAVEWFAVAAPEHWVRSIVEWRNERWLLQAVMNEVGGWPMCGPWIAFKAADMLERLGLAPVAFPSDTGLFYKEPAAALRLLVEMEGGSVKDHWNRLSFTFQVLSAPPRYERPCGPAEVESVLCKWKSHTRGHYPIGKDIREVRHALKGWGATAERMLVAMPEEVS